MSKQYELNKEDLKKIAVGAMVAAGAALVTYLTPIITSIHWTVAGMDLTPLVVVLWGVLINAARKFVTAS